MEKVVGAARFELTTSCSQSRRSTRLSYAPSRGGDSVAKDQRWQDNFYHCGKLSIYPARRLLLKPFVGYRSLGGASDQFGVFGKNAPAITRFWLHPGGTT